MCVCMCVKEREIGALSRVLKWRYSQEMGGQTRGAFELQFVFVVDWVGYWCVDPWKDTSTKAHIFSTP